MSILNSDSRYMTASAVREALGCDHADLIAWAVEGALRPVNGALLRSEAGMVAQPWVTYYLTSEVQAILDDTVFVDLR